MRCFVSAYSVRRTTFVDAFKRPASDPDLPSRLHRRNARGTAFAPGAKPPAAAAPPPARASHGLAPVWRATAGGS